MTLKLGTLTDAVALPRLVWLRPNLVAAAFTLMKIVPARYILRRAAADGRLLPGGRIAETTSGTFGLALAMEAAVQGWQLTLVTDPVVDPRLAARLRDLGARVDIVRDASATGGYQQARLDRLRALLAEYPDTFCPEQYTNPDNPASYRAVAEQLAGELGQVDVLVGPVGSGGSMCGTGGHLRRAFPDLVAVGVDTHDSVLFGQPDGPRELRGLGNSLMPANVDHTVFDQVHWLSAAHAYRETRRLHQSHAMFMGPTSGAAFAVASWHAARNPDLLHVVLLPDEGYRYQDTVYDDTWLRRHGTVADPAEPREVFAPDDGRAGWACLNWRRRTLDEVTRHTTLRRAS